MTRSTCLRRAWRSIDLGHDTSELPFCGVLAASVRDAGVPDELVAVVSQRDRWSYPEAVRV